MSFCVLCGVCYVACAAFYDVNLIKAFSRAREPRDARARRARASFGGRGGRRGAPPRKVRSGSESVYLLYRIFMSISLKIYPLHRILNPRACTHRTPRCTHTEHVHTPNSDVRGPTTDEDTAHGENRVAQVWLQHCFSSASPSGGNALEAAR